MEMLSASEIAALNIPGIPSTKVAIRAMAEREGWRYEERTGIGGRRRVYELPARFHPFLPGAKEGGSQPLQPGVAGTIAGGRKADPVRLSWAVKALEEWSAENGVAINPDRKGAIIAVLYDYLERGAGEAEVTDLLRVLR